ncbi:hypothetical protein LOY54_11510 [Pseudomonas sp. B21-032]|uniref:hypothetical protein n=1 Tax=Pseudomonas sp. B21-032 TaxID=2895483 RepID=UPI00215E9A49|nr:hypothetical protein [Pseudomonas sp. B21-032]UVL63853.1 hypothetical protein LOY54_11510 [Pseudomonas sp. B21-032]
MSQSPQLDWLVQAALAHNRDLAVVQANVQVVTAGGNAFAMAVLFGQGENRILKVRIVQHMKVAEI